MAKSEIPSIVVQTGGCPMEGGGRGTNGSSPPPAPPPCGPPPPRVQPVRLSKQSEVEMAEEQAPAPVTIRLEVGTEEEASPQPVDNTSRASAQRLKVLVRSHALRDDASPPLDLSPEAATASPQMLSVQGPVSCKVLPGNKPARLSKQGTSSSQGSLEGSSPSLSRDSSTETYTDSTGVDLEQFIVDTLHKNHKDRVMMLKIEQDLLSLVKDNKRQSFKFAQMSSYHRMLVHRVAAYFGLDHNVDQAGTAVIVSKTRNTRLPDIRFKDQIREDLLSEEPKKLILKRDSASFEDGKESPERQLSLDSRRSKSIEEREEEYEKARARIFNQDEGVGDSPASRSSQEELQWSGDNRPWSSTDSDSSERRRHLGARLLLAPKTAEGVAQGEPLAGGKFYSVLTKGGGGPGGPAVTKASSFGGVSLLHRDSSLTEARNAALRAVKADSFNVSSLPTVVQAPPPVATSPAEVPSLSAAPESAAPTGPQVGEEASPVAAAPAPPPPHVATAAPHAPRPQFYVAQLPWGAAPREAGALSLPPMWPLAGPSVLEASSLTPTGLLLNPQAVAGVPLVSPDMAGGLVQGVRPRGGPGPLGGGGLLLSPLAPPRGPVPTHPHHHHHQHHHHHPHQQQPPQQLVYLPCVQPPTSLEARKPGLLDTQEPPGCEAVAGQLGSLTLVGGDSAEGASAAGHPQGGFLVQAPLQPGFLALPGHPPPTPQQQQQQQQHQQQQQQQQQQQAHAAPTVSVQGPIYYVQPAPMTTCGRNYVSSVPEAHANPQLGLATAGPQTGALIAGSPVGGGSYPVWGYYAPPMAGLSNGAAEAGPPPPTAFLGTFAAPLTGQGEPYHQHHHHHAPPQSAAPPQSQHQQLVPMYLVATSPPAGPPHQQPPPPASLPLRYLRPQTPPASSAQAQQQPLVGYALCSAGPPVVPPQHPLPPMVTAFQSLVPCVAARPAVASNAAGASRASLVGPASFAVGLPGCGMAKSGTPYLGMGAPTHPAATTPYGDGSPGERVASGGDASSMGSMGVSGGEDGQHHHHQQQRHRGGAGRNGSRTPAAASQPASTVAAMAALYRHSRGLSLLPDVRLLGHPLQQHHEGPPQAMLRGALRLVSQPPPAPATLGARPPRSTRRQPRAAPRAPSNPPSSAPMPTTSSTTPAAAGGGQVLEVLGLADGLAPNEVEQQLEPLLRLGAQLKRVGTSPPQLLVCFDSAAAAQGALLMAGLPFQLRPLPPVASPSSSSELLPPPPSSS
ncbi:R3H domain-containing protein 2 isoform X2 [Rhipicephalus sanguineus]|uniref:R3H domain-containing protein 2 isoform X2 n=1 Tax=Rhipicephalus sanguineus TaxID=34632 RepID=UPI0018956BB7|nr:R3H domain-containing protein 2 isoform X2 [Rhipicephalus sanguineus]